MNAVALVVDDSAVSKVMPEIEREYERQHPDQHNGHHHEEVGGGRFSREF